MPALACLAMAIAPVACGGSDTDDPTDRAGDAPANAVSGAQGKGAPAAGRTDAGDGSPGAKPSDGTSADRKPPDRIPSDRDRADGKGAAPRSSPPGPTDSEPATPATPPPGATADSARVARTVERMYASFAAADAAGVCATMSRAVRTQIAQQMPGGSTEPPENRTCVDSFSKFLDQAAGSGMLESTLNATVGDVRVDGDAATAVVALGGRSGEVRLVREDGAWRFGAPPQAPGR